MKVPRRQINAAARWLKAQPANVKAIVGITSAILVLLFLRLVVEDHDNLFIAAEAVHSIGISVLIYKLIKEDTCAVRVEDSVFSYTSAVGRVIEQLGMWNTRPITFFLCLQDNCMGHRTTSFVMEYDIHTLLDLATLATTVWVIYMMRFQLTSTYMEEKDKLPHYYVVLPCVLLAIFVHPSTHHHIFNRISWGFCVYLEAVSVLPQLHIMQQTKIVEPFTAHYVFALGVARFFSCAHWILQVLDTRGRLLTALGYGLWPSMVLLSEFVQTFILADFCYYYVKSLIEGHSALRLPSGVV
ncbi:hypothetical protein Leryth_006155 [Lithospermum erythrorhizon]|nr:hypothetical protein Leryth_006155 [Lithospermum erythrorhizon]